MQGNDKRAERALHALPSRTLNLNVRPPIQFFRAVLAQIPANCKAIREV